MKDNSIHQHSIVLVHIIRNFKCTFYMKIDSMGKDWRSHIKLWRQLGIGKYTSKIDKSKEKQELAKYIK